MVAISQLLVASATLFAVGRASNVPRTILAAAATWNNTDTESVMAILGLDNNADPNGYPVSCDSDCSGFAEVLGNELGAAVNASSSGTSSSASTTAAETAAVCTSSFYADTKKCANCVIAGNSTSSIAAALPALVSQLAAGCNTTISLTGGSNNSSGSSSSSSSTTGAAGSLYRTVGWAPAMGLAVVAGVATLL